MRQVVLDTETTGLDPLRGHRLIEIGCVELVNRRITGQTFHVYIKPDCEVDSGAFRVHGISNEFLADKPEFSDIVEDFLTFVKGAECIIHNAPFDLGFINHELKMLQHPIATLEQISGVIDTLVMARELHPGQKNSLDALCKRYAIDNSKRTLHGALLDSEILAEVYLSMTGGQSSLSLEANDAASNTPINVKVVEEDLAFRDVAVIMASPDECRKHLQRLEKMAQANEADSLWQILDT